MKAGEINTVFSNFVIAEIGSVHDGSFGNAQRLVDLALEVGADAVKFQTHLPEFEVTTEARRPKHFGLEDRFSYFMRTGFTLEKWRELIEYCDLQGITFISSAFSVEAIDVLNDLGVEIHKIPSGEVTNIPLVEAVAASQKPTLLSTGMSNWAEIDDAVAILRPSLNELNVLQCTSLYPCPPEKIGLNVLAEIRDRYDLESGLSDHSFGPAAAIAAASLGATVIEKHLTFSRRMYGSDAPYAMEPHEFRDMVSLLREVWKMEESPVDKDSLVGIEDTRETFLAVAVAREFLEAGHKIVEQDLTFMKAGAGVLPRDAHLLLGRRLKHPKERFQKLLESDVVE